MWKGSSHGLGLCCVALLESSPGLASVRPSCFWSVDHIFHSQSLSLSVHGENNNPSSSYEV